MKKFDEEDIICTSNKGITVVFDEEASAKYSDSMHQRCFAMREISMNYGFFFTVDGSAGTYGARSKEILDIYWDSNANEIEKSLSKARRAIGFDKFIEVGAEILVSCSLAVKAFVEYEQSLGA